MHLFSYKLEHDYGLAPNPFGGTMSLAVCRGQIRNSKVLQLGDWIVGTGSVAMGNLYHLIFAMKVEEIISFDDYWSDSRFQFKKPVLSGTLVQMYGDNFYHTVDGHLVQEPSAHSNPDLIKKQKLYTQDVRGKKVLLSRTFYYFGDNCPLLPDEYLNICCNGRSIKYKSILEEQIHDFVTWLEKNYTVGIHGDPCNWKEFNLPKLDIYDDGEE